MAVEIINEQSPHFDTVKQIWRVHCDTLIFPSERLIIMRGPRKSVALKAVVTNVLITNHTLQFPLTGEVMSSKGTFVSEPPTGFGPGRHNFCFGRSGLCENEVDVNVRTVDVNRLSGELLDAVPRLAVTAS